MHVEIIYARRSRKQVHVVVFFQTHPPIGQKGYTSLPALGATISRKFVALSTNNGEQLLDTLLAMRHRFVF